MKVPENFFLVLAGGNALGAYQAGACEALNEQGLEPNWIAGASIGAVTGAIIAGNWRDERIAQLRRFWRMAEQFGKSDPSASHPDPRGSRLQKRAAATPYAPEVLRRPVLGIYSGSPYPELAIGHASGGGHVVRFELLRRWVLLAAA